MENKTKTVSITLIVIGCLILMYPLFTQWQVDQSQQHVEKDWKKLNQVYANSIEADNEVHQKVDENTKESQYFEVKVDETKEEAADNGSTTLDHRKEVEEHQVLGKLTIQKIDLEVMVVPGVEEEDIQHAIGWMTSTGFPGEAGNVVLAGHRSHYTYGKFFHRLGEMEIGDQLSLNTHFGSFDYQVKEIKVVEPTDLSVLEHTDRSLLTLITCEPLYSNDYRLIVIAEELEPTGRSVSYR
jgi:sortase A